MIRFDGFLRKLELNQGHNSKSFLSFERLIDKAKTIISTGSQSMCELLGIRVTLKAEFKILNIGRKAVAWTGETPELYKENHSVAKR